MPDGNARFTGSIPRIYHDHLGPLLFEPFAADLASRLTWTPGTSLLELAAGTGILTRHLRERHPETTIVATDLNEAMLDIAKANVGAWPGLDWRQADATALPFPPESFDAVVCQFGVMFFPDKLAAAREVRRVLRPGGRFLFNVWDSFAFNPITRITHERIGSFFSSSPPDFYRVPYGYYDIEVIRTLLLDAGFDDLQRVVVDFEGRSVSAEHAAIGLVRGNPVLLAIEERGTAAPDAIVDDLARALAAEYGDRPMRAPMRAHIWSGIR